MNINKMKIYSRNIFGIPLFAGNHKARISRLAEQIKAVGAHIILLQEVFLPRDRRQLERCLGNEFDMHRPMTGFLKLGGGLCGFFKKGIGIESCFSSFRSSGFLSDLTITDKIAKKGFQIFTIRHPFQLTVIHTHLTCPYIKDLDSDKKIKRLLADQLSLITRYLQENVMDPIVVCGDFNLEPTQDLMVDFINRNRLKDQSVHLSTTMLGNHYFPQWLFHSSCNAKKPDYVLTRNIPEDWQISLQTAMDDKLISDHMGIIATIRF